MNAEEFVRVVATPNLEEFKADPTNYRKMWNAFVSMNTVPEWMAFDQTGYNPLTQDQVQAAYKAMRRQHPEFVPVKEGTEMLKHVRLLENGKVTASSTEIQVNDHKTWMLKSRPLGDILDQASAACSSIFPSS